MILQHRNKVPNVDRSAYIAPNAVVCGDVTIGKDSRVLFGAVISAEGGPVRVGSNCIIMENSVIRGTLRHPTTIGDNVLVGPHAHLSGCTVESNAFVATGASVFNGARIGQRSEVRINAVVHIRTRVPDDTTVPIGWVAVGDPVEILPPNDHARIWELLKALNFPKEVFGLERTLKGQTIMPELTGRYANSLGLHKEDRTLESGMDS